MIILSLTILRFILTAWLLSLVPSVPNLFIFTTTGEPQAQECSPHKPMIHRREGNLEVDKDRDVSLEKKATN